MSALMTGAAIAGSHCGAAGEPIDTLWGFADLHAHLAFHLAYGATLTQDEKDVAQWGIMYGRPGGALDKADVQSDLGACDGDKHGSANPIANVLLTQLAKVLGTPHGPAGYPSFDNWPLATAGLHQQMHVTWLKRAYDGGQRLMVASAVENALLASVFSGNLQSPGASAINAHEKDVVLAQLQFIKDFALANSTWLEVVKDADAAENAISHQRMALVLGTEVDTLNADEIAELYEKYDVRVFIPIHLADNSLGGTAVYEDMFNIHSTYVNGTGYAVQSDKHLSFALKLNLSSFDLLGLPLVDPTNPENAGVLPGHRNKKGLTQAGKDAIQKMVDLGAIIDVAHMSEASIKDTLDIVEPLQVPVIDSHTGVRTAGESAVSERDLRFDSAMRIGKLGGMIGLGTGGITAEHDPNPTRIFFDSPFATIPAASPTHTESLPTPQPAVVCKGLSLAITTGDDDLRENSSATLDVVPGPSAPHDLNHGLQIDNGKVLRVLVPLPDDTLASRVGATLHHQSQNGCFQRDDKWNVAHITMTCGPHAFESNGAMQIAKGDSYPIGVTTTDTSMVTTVMADVWTGDSALDGSSTIDIDVKSSSGVTTCTALENSGLASKTLQRLQCTLPSAVAMNTINTVSLHRTAGDGTWDVKAATAGLDDGAASPSTFIDEPFPPLELENAQQILLASATLPQHMVRLTIVSDSAGAATKGIDATATFQFGSGPDQTFRLNKGAAMSGGKIDAGLSVEIPIGSSYQFYVILDQGRLSTDIKSLRIDAPNLAMDWPITRVELEAFEEPVERWVADLDQTTHALGRSTDCFMPNILCGVALGTDLNGMAPGIPGTTLSPYDPNQPGQYVLDYLPELGGHPAVAGRLQTGPIKTWDVMNDGIAHVGMLPDFLVAAAHAKQRSDAAQVVSTIFHSAGDFVRMWRKIKPKQQ